MLYNEDHSAAKDLTLGILTGSQLINISVVAFTMFAMNTHYDENGCDLILQASYLIITSIYMLTHHQFIFVTSNIKSRFQLLNKNLL